MIKFFMFLGTIFYGVLSFAQIHTHDDSIEHMTKEILSYVNQYRVAHGRLPLKMNTEAHRMAVQHSMDMAKHRISFGHDGFSKRMKYLSHAVPDVDGGAENVAYNYKTAKIVVNGWINSPGHRHKLMGNYDLTGIGIVPDQQGKLYFTQLFLHTNHHQHPAHIRRGTHFYIH